ncbi:hypothetical protein [Cerasicoccus maritimus]|uniref:hypothetical protein n=1 Tax=Cerasicoccus maritimus TaxID=490089 RepID=UPI002852AD7E|nr:hypothetical protein [Cerasicoccus maritimus]
MKYLTTLLVFSLGVSSASAGFFDSLKDSATEQAKSSAESAASDAIGSDAASTLSQAASMQSMVANAVDTSKQLQSLLGSNPELQSLLTNSMTSLAQKQDYIALQDINKLMDAKLTDEQKGLATSLRSDVEVLALKRQLPDSGPVTAATKAIQGGDYQGAVAQLNTVMKSGTLTDGQKQLVSSIISEHAPTVAK